MSTELYLMKHIRYELPHGKTYAKTKVQISLAVTVKLISTFVFPTRIVQILFLDPKFPASNHLL